MAANAMQTRRLVAESIAVVASILLAFAIDAAWNDRQERSEERALLTGLRQEFVLNRANVELQVGRIEVAMDRLRLYSALEQFTPGVLDADSAFALLVQPVVRSYTSELSDGFLEATISSGKLALIDDVELRALLAETSSRDQDVSEMRRVVMDLSVTGATALGRFSELSSLMDESDQFPETWSASWRANSDPDVLAVVRAKRLYMVYYRNSLVSLGEHFDAIITSIDAALGK